MPFGETEQLVRIAQYDALPSALDQALLLIDLFAGQRSYSFIRVHTSSNRFTFRGFLHRIGAHGFI